MTGKSSVVWSMKELTEHLRARQLNRFDVNIGVSGKRGHGKSSMLFKIFNSFKKYGFIQKKQQVYDRDDIMLLLANQKYGFCWDDEAINSGYKRDFQNAGQKELIKLITNYRDNFNVYASALPFFYSLDKDLRELMFMHIHIIERGLAVILMPLEDQIHLKDPWDSENNKKIELKELKRVEMNPGTKFRYHRFSTFAGYIYFSAMTKGQEKYYRNIKEKKRAKKFKQELPIKKKSDRPFLDRIYEMLLEGKLTREGLIQSCYVEGKKHSSMVKMLNQKLKETGQEKTLGEMIRGEAEKPKQEAKETLNELIPQL